MSIEKNQRKQGLQGGAAADLPFSNLGMGSHDGLWPLDPSHVEKLRDEYMDASRHEALLQSIASKIPAENDIEDPHGAWRTVRNSLQFLEADFRAGKTISWKRLFDLHADIAFQEEVDGDRTVSSAWDSVAAAHDSEYAAGMCCEEAHLLTCVNE